ncbi:MAG: DUF4233 domain-containing protein [Pseudonocardiaceae bacterium]|nr:DUF4233 domain-containing protein [Pseudonocardiaceae bacterium]
MRSFRGVMAGTLLLEAIVVALALPLVAKLGDGVGTGQGLLVLGLVVALLVACALLRYRWVIGVIVAIQLVMVAGLLAMTALGVIGVLFLLVWGYLFWLRRDVAKRMAEGRLPSQQQ